MNRPLTAAQLADALGYFSNTAISAMHRNTAPEACIAQGIDAVACRLAEIATENEAQPAAFTPIGSGVKALEWEHHPQATGQVRASSPWGTYRIVFFGDYALWGCRADGTSLGNKAASIDEAKAAAQSDFERRVLSCLTHTAGAGPVGEAVAFRKGADIAEDGSDQAIYGIDMLTNEHFTTPWWGNRIEVYGKKGGEKLRDRILAFLTARPAEEPGDVERLTRERDDLEAMGLRAASDYASHVADLEAALAETRERLEKREEVLREIGSNEVPIGLIRKRARAVLTGDAQEGGK